MALTPEQKNTILGSLKGDTKLPQQSNVEYLQKLRQPKVGGFFQEGLADLKGIGTGIGESLERRRETVGEINESKASGETGAITSEFQRIGQGAGFAGDILGEGFMGVLKAFSPQSVEDKTGEFVGEAAQDFMSTVQDPENKTPGAVLIRKYQELKETDPEKARTIDAAFNLLALGGDVVGGGATIRGAKEGIEVAGRGLAKTKLAVVNKTDDLRNVFRGKQIDTLPEQQAQLTKNFKDNIIGDGKAINNRIDKLALRNNTDSDTLLKELIEEGGLPEVDGKTINYQPFIESVGREKKAVSQAINRRADQIVENTNLDAFKNDAMNTLKGARANASTLPASESKLDKIFEAYRKKYGDNLTASNINEIRVEMNKVFKEADVFEVDTHNAIGGASRRRLEELDPDITEGLAHSSKLNRVEGVANALKREKITVNEYVERMGGFGGIMLTTGLGISTIAGGPAGLLIAGMGANLGSKALASVLRKRAFSPERFNLIKASLNENPEILQKLIREADKADANTLNTLLLEEGAIRVAPVDRSGVKAIPDEGLKAKGAIPETNLINEATTELSLNNLDPNDFASINDFKTAYKKNPVLKSNIDMKTTLSTQDKTVGDVLSGDLANKYKNVSDVRIETLTPESQYYNDIKSNIQGMIGILENDELVIFIRQDTPINRIKPLLLEEIDHAATYRRNPGFITRDAEIAHKGTFAEYKALPAERAADKNVQKRLLESQYTAKELEDIYKNATSQR